jgi:hypothetical protein
MTAVIRAYDAAIDSVDKADRSLVARINTAGVDRYNTVIDPRGANLRNYQKNPQFLWEHGRDPRRHTDPIGRNVWIKTNGGQRPTELLARTKFLNDEFSQQRYEWYRDGVLNAFSVNILPVHERCGPPTGEEIRAVPEWGNVATIYREWDLAEYSGTVIPGNADCLVSERAAKMLDLVSRNLLWLPDDVRPLVEGRASVKRYITHSGDKWIVHAEDGKVLGEHDSEEGAKEQLEAVEAHKHDDRKANPGKPPVANGRTAPYVDTDGQTWAVRSAEGVALALYDDATIADEALRLMLAAKPGGPRGFERTLVAMLVEQRAHTEQLFEDMIGRLELKLYGRV